MPAIILLLAFFCLSFSSGFEHLYKQDNAKYDAVSDSLLSSQLMIFREALFMSISSGKSGEVLSSDLSLPIVLDNKIRGFIYQGESFTVCDGCSSVRSELLDKLSGSENVGIYRSGKVISSIDGRVLKTFPFNVKNGSSVIIN